eukprot:2062717-Pleurochrysis_carterae.AAC.1
MESTTYSICSSQVHPSAQLFELPRPVPASVSYLAVSVCPCVSYPIPSPGAHTPAYLFTLLPPGCNVSLAPGGEEEDAADKCDDEVEHSLVGGGAARHGLHDAARDVELLRR